MADTSKQSDLVRLEALAGPSPVAEATAGELSADLVGNDRQPGGEALDDGDEPAPVGLARGQIAQHRRSLRPGAARRELAEALRRPWSVGRVRHELGP